ncbi:CaiB/BaiF CoA-transferase family protein [Nocardia sp. NPDC050378]|uniref:CaiB/BaiF CoA transferase family protein n=1 Tax=Nocardia sp. NPDC050378 TaxID=3155400 RepID=UPI0033EF8330
MSRRTARVNNPGPLTGLTVVDLSTVFAAPYMCSLLSDFGAEVIKIEAPAKLDQTRGGALAPIVGNESGGDAWNWSGSFHSLNRGKRSVVLDLKQEAGRAVLRRLVDTADIVVENFTPRVLRGWGMTYDELATTNSGLIMLSNTGYGATGPWSGFKAQGTSLESTMGLTEYSGYPGDKPRKVGQSYPDFLAAWSGLSAILAALAERRNSGRGQWIDLGMYQLGPVVIPEALIAAQAGIDRPARQGNAEDDTVLSEVYACRGEEAWVAVALENDVERQQAIELVREHLSSNDPDLADLTRGLGAWTATRTPDEAAEILQSRGIAAAPVAEVRNMLLDNQFRHRSFFDWVDVKGETRAIPGTPFVWTGTSTAISRGRGPIFGEDNDTVLASLGLSQAEIETLRRDAVVVDEPQGIRPPRAKDLAALVRAHVYREIATDVDDVLARVRPPAGELRD